jgi:hypothetical protein
VKSWTMGGLCQSGKKMAQRRKNRAQIDSHHRQALFGKITAALTLEMAQSGRGEAIWLSTAHPP